MSSKSATGTFYSATPLRTSSLEEQVLHVQATSSRRVGPFVSPGACVPTLDQILELQIFALQTFELQTFALQTFELQTFELQTFELQTFALQPK